MGTFFDDASLVMIPSGVKDGKLYSIKPVPEYGSEGVTNGTFNTDLTGWSTDDFSNGSIVHSSGSAFITSNGLGTGYPSIWQQVTTVVGKIYRVTANFTNNTTGIWFWKFDNNSPLGNTNRVLFINNDSDSSIDAEFEFTATATLSSISAFAEQGNSGSFNFDNVSVKEVITDPADFTFTRGTDTATRVNSAGIIEKETQNLLLQSNTFDTTWTNVNTTETSGQSGYDGSNDAWLLAKSAQSARIEQSVSHSGVQTFSVYAKAGTLNWIRLIIGSAQAFYDLANGVVGSTVNNTIEHNIYDIGSGWYRCEMVVNLSVTIAGIYPAQNDGNVSGTSGNIYIQDAQLEQGLLARDVITTTTAAVYAGITDNLPRLDYSGGASCPSLLLEPQRTNVVTDSEYFGVWNVFRATITNNATTSPEGLANAAALTEDTTTNSHPLNKTFSVSSGVEHTLTIFAKQGSRRYLALFAINGGSNIYYDLQEKTAGSGGSVEDYGNGWLRLIYTYTTNSTSAELYIQPSINGSSAVYTGDGSNAVFLYGAQIEAGSYPTSYIPTMGVSATRAADSCSVTGVSDVIGQTEGTLFAQVGEFPKENNGRVFAISDGTADTYISIIKNGANTNFAVYVDVSGVAQVSYTGSGTLANNSKIAVGYKNNDYAIYVNGTQVHTDASASVPACDEVHVGQRENGSVTFIAGGSLKQTTLFKTRLSNAELATLTTL